MFYAELNELLTRELAEHGYSGVEVRVTPMRTEIIIKATRTQNVLGEMPVAPLTPSPHPCLTIVARDRGRAAEPPSVPRVTTRICSVSDP